MFHRIIDSVDFYGNSPALLQQLFLEISLCMLSSNTEIGLHLLFRIVNILLLSYEMFRFWKGGSLFCAFFGFLFQPSLSADFSDVSPITSFSSDIEALQSRHIIQGYSDGTYRPESLINNRYDFVKLLSLLNFASDICCVNRLVIFPRCRGLPLGRFLLCLQRNRALLKDTAMEHSMGEEYYSCRVSYLFSLFFCSNRSAPSRSIHGMQHLWKSRWGTIFTELEPAMLPNRFLNRGEMAYLFER